VPHDARIRHTYISCLAALARHGIKRVYDTTQDAGHVVQHQSTKLPVLQSVAAEEFCRDHIDVQLNIGSRHGDRAAYLKDLASLLLSTAVTTTIFDSIHDCGPLTTQLSHL